MNSIVYEFMIKQLYKIFIQSNYIKIIKKKIHLIISEIIRDLSRFVKIISTKIII